MDAGDVELSGAVDFSPNELGEKPKTQEVKNAETTVETASKPASIKEEDVRFYSDNIKTSNNDMFVRVEGGDRLKRAARRREERERKEALREAKIASRREEAASKQVADSEKQLKKEQRRLIKEQRQQKRRARREKVLGWIKKHWYIFAAIVVDCGCRSGCDARLEDDCDAHKRSRRRPRRNNMSKRIRRTFRAYLLKWLAKS